MADRRCGFGLLTAVLVLPLLLAAQAFAGPAFAGPTSADVSGEFRETLDLSSLRTLSVQHNQVLKTFDTFCRQVLTTVTGRGNLDGHDPVFTVLDMAYRPTVYRDRPLIKIRHVPLRQDVAAMPGLDPAFADQLVYDGLISLAFFDRPDVKDLLLRQRSQAAHKADAIRQLAGSAETLRALLSGGVAGMFAPAAIIPPPIGAGAEASWRRTDEVAAGLPALAFVIEHQGHAVSPLPVGYDAGRLEPVGRGLSDVLLGWAAGDAARVNAATTSLATALTAVNPERYPSPLKRSAEVVYNRASRLTLPGAAVYFVAFVLFLAAGRSGWGRLRTWGLLAMTVGLLVHTAGIGVRWWLVEKSTGDWFHSIPIKNQFESVLFSAWFGVIVGLTLAWWRRNAFFGAAGAFVGWLSLIALFGTPYVFGRDIGGEIGHAAGILMSYWLYIHVTMVVASYALITMGLLLGMWWLAAYYSGRPRGGGGGSSRRRGFETVPAVVTTGDTGAAVLRKSVFGASESLEALFREQVTATSPVTTGTASATAPAAFTFSPERRDFLHRLDQCNLVVLQLAFWILGVGIIFGAVWADMSWGRPWGWDPKETFALVTWIVYLIVVHVRLAAKDPTSAAWWTAALSIIGFAVMLFNWVGVNFFLVGLHSYA